MYVILRHVIAFVLLEEYFMHYRYIIDCIVRILCTVRARLQEIKTAKRQLYNNPTENREKRRQKKEKKERNEGVEVTQSSTMIFFHS